jgi:hypothetical protein
MPIGLRLALGTYIASSVTPDWDFNELLLPQICAAAAHAVYGADQQSVLESAARAAEECVGTYNLTRLVAPSASQ